MSSTKWSVWIAVTLLLLCSCSMGAQKLQSPNPNGIADTTDLNSVREVYVSPFVPSGRAFTHSWNSPYELEVDEIVCYAAFNNLLQKPTKDPKLNVPDGGNYLDNYAPAQSVENMVQQYFDVSVDYLRSSKLYEYEGYQNSYLLPDGYGGSGWNKVLGAEQKNNILYIEVGVGGPDNLTEPSIKGILEVELGEGTFRYLSYTLTQHPNDLH